MSWFSPSTWFSRSDPITPYIAELIDYANEFGMRLKVVSTRRSQRDQDRLYRQGRDTDGPIVTWTRRSKHTSGRAVDVTIVGSPEYEDDPESWELLGLLGEDLGLRWGGSYSDFGHFEI